MDYRLIKGVSMEEVIRAYESQKGKDKPFSIEDKYVCSLEPGSNLRSAGTLQKSVFEFSRDTNFNNNDNLYLVVNSKMNWSDQPQKYAVVVVLESEDCLLYTSCVIDSGIFMQHPLFRGVIGDSKTFYCSDDYRDNSNDYDGHGTAVASICEYGAVSYTHLDVYKRQILFSAAARWLGEILPQPINA